MLTRECRPAFVQRKEIFSRQDDCSREGRVKKFQWGILGSGLVARKFALGLRTANDARVLLVASRSATKATELAQWLGIPHVSDSYEAAANDTRVDAFYLATPPSTHREIALPCLNAGKPVLVEKPFAQNATQAREIVEAAKAQSVFCMEGMWTRFLPLLRRVKQMVDEGTIGDVRMIAGSFCAAESRHPGNKLFSSASGGGALLDRGVYPISLAFHLLGRPDEISHRH